MTASAFANQSNSTTIAHRPLVDTLVERLARNLLAWSDRRAKTNQLTHERMVLILENQRSAHRGGSSFDA